MSRAPSRAAAAICSKTSLSLFLPLFLSFGLFTFLYLYKKEEKTPEMINYPDLGRAELLQEQLLRYPPQRRRRAQHFRTQTFGNVKNGSYRRSKYLLKNQYRL